MQFESVFEYGFKVLHTEETDEKASLTKEARQLYLQGKLPILPPSHETFHKIMHSIPEYPARQKNLNVVKPSETARRGVGSVENRISLIHSLTHMESCAIDLSWDIMLRYLKDYTNEQYECKLPCEFFEDWLKVAEDEARHYGMLNQRLKELGSFYGQCTVHQGLWESALQTKHNLLARIGVMHILHEGRGLDITVKNIEKVKGGQDSITADLFEKIYVDEITHVTAGVKWFKYISQLDVCIKENKEFKEDVLTHQQIMECFYDVVRKNFHGSLKPPFNHEAREKAGMTREWYEPLVKKQDEQKKDAQTGHL